MSNIANIKKRKSVRSFKKEEFSNNLIQEITAKIDSLENGYFGNEIKFYLIDKKRFKQEIKFETYGLFKNARYYLVSVIDEATCNDDVFLDLGYMFERLILFITGLGLGSCWVSRTFNSGQFSNVLELDENEFIPAICPIGFPAKSISIREKIAKKIANSDNRKPWHRIFFEDDLSHPLIREIVGQYSVPLEMVRIAPSARNSQPWKIIKSENTYHFFIDDITDENPYDLRLIDIGIAMLHFEYSIRELNLAGRWIFQKPNLNLKGNLKYMISWESE